LVLEKAREELATVGVGEEEEEGVRVGEEEDKAGGMHN
jgi:hypothetical protein